MPFVRMMLRAVRSKEQERAISQAICEAMRESMGLSAREKCPVQYEYGGERLLAAWRPAGSALPPEVVLVYITLRQGRRPDQKQALYKLLPVLLETSAGVHREDVFIVVREDARPGWGFGSAAAQSIAS